MSLLDIPSGTEISAHLFCFDEDGATPDYIVYEEMPPVQEGGEQDEGDGFLPALLSFPGDVSNEDVRTATLRIDVNSISVHHVKGVTYGVERHDVQRHREEKRKLDF